MRSVSHGVLACFPAGRMEYPSVDLQPDYGKDQDGKEYKQANLQ